MADFSEADIDALLAITKNLTAQVDGAVIDDKSSSTLACPMTPPRRPPSDAQVAAAPQQNEAAQSQQSNDAWETELWYDTNRMELLDLQKRLERNKKELEPIHLKYLKLTEENKNIEARIGELERKLQQGPPESSSATSTSAEGPTLMPSTPTLMPSTAKSSSAVDPPWSGWQAPLQQVGAIGAKLRRPPPPPPPKHMPTQPKRQRGERRGQHVEYWSLRTKAKREGWEHDFHNRFPSVMTSAEMEEAREAIGCWDF
jgi:hypothetical protein